MSFASAAPLKRARNLLLGGDGYRSRLLLNLNDPVNGRDAVTGSILQIQDSSSPSAGFYTEFGRFLAGYACNGSGIWVGTRGLVSTAPSRVWDVASDTGDFTLSFWFRCNSVPPSLARQYVSLNEEPFDSNNYIVCGLGSASAGTQIRATLTTSIANNFVSTIAYRIPVDLDWHFYTAARIDDTYYVTIDGGAPVAGSTLTTSYRRSPGARSLLIGTDGVAGQMDGTLDAIWLVDGTPYDVINGFAVPTAAPVLY